MISMVHKCTCAQKDWHCTSEMWRKEILQQADILTLYTFLALYPLKRHPRGGAFFRMYGQPHDGMCSLPVSVLYRVGSAKKPAKRAETGIEPGSRHLESSVLDRSATVATKV